MVIWKYLYAPNTDEPTFFEGFEKKIVESDCLNVIMGGAFNLTLIWRWIKKVLCTTIRRPVNN